MCHLCFPVPLMGEWFELCMTVTNVVVLFNPLTVTHHTMSMVH